MKIKLHLGIYVSALAIGASLIPTDSTAGSYSAICQDGGQCNVILLMENQHSWPIYRLGRCNQLVPRWQGITE